MTRLPQTTAHRSSMPYSVNGDIHRGKRERSGSVVQERCARLTHNDVTGIDGDIEMLIGLLQKRHGYTRDKANAELVRKLSFAM